MFVLGKLNILFIVLRNMQAYFCAAKQMRSFTAILLSLTILLQAIPVLHFFSEKPEIFYVAIDEEKPGEKSNDAKDDKTDDKSFWQYSLTGAAELKLPAGIHSQTSSVPSSPYLEMVTPPPHQR